MAKNNTAIDEADSNATVNMTMESMNDPIPAQCTSTDMHGPNNE